MKPPIKVWNERHQALIAELKQGLELRAEPGASAQGQSQAKIAGFLDGLADLTETNRFYLARNFDGPQKRLCARKHYDLLLERFAPEALLRLVNGNLPFWSLEAEEIAFSMSLRLEHWVAREGELTIEMIKQRKMLYLLSFTFVPAALFGLDGETVMLVSRLQGRPGDFDAIRAATKAMSEVSPRAAVFAGLAGFARAAGVRRIVGVGAENHVGFQPEKREALVRQYDEFFPTLDAEPLAPGFFVIDTEAEPKPVTAQKTGHRVRTRRKREFKARLADSAAQLWSSLCDPAKEASAA